MSLRPHSDASDEPTMSAMALTRPGMIEKITLPVPTPGAGEVLVKIAAVGICGSDLATYVGSSVPPSYPWVMGHEGGGEIVAVGDGVDRARVGSLVAIEPNYYVSAPDGTSLWRSIGVNVPGMLAEFVTVPASHAWDVDPGLDEAVLISLEPLAVAEAARRRSGIARGSRALVIGAGSTGLAMVAVLIEGGIDVSFTDPHPGRSERARRMGASPLIEGELFPFVFETAGAATTLSSALQRASTGAVVIVTGLSTAVTEVTAADFVRRQLTLIGSLTYEHPKDFTAVLLADRIDTSELAPYQYDFSAVGEAYSQARSLDGKSWVSLS